MPSQALLLKPNSSRRCDGKKEKKGGWIACQATSVPADDRVPDMGKRELMNLLLLGALSLPTAGMLVPYASFFVPPGSVFYALFTCLYFSLACWHLLADLIMTWEFCFSSCEE